ncbi:hypothetical protein N9242_01195 [Vicingaceae bacterium]|nr:hypothetical protein [Vicingaceae bacterium]
MAKFGAILFQILAPLQLALMLFLSATQCASNVAVEKDRQTIILLLMTRLTNSELVLGKLLASLLSIAVMLLTALPIFMLVVCFGGVSFAQVGWAFAVTGITALVAGSLGSTIALWREKTFQTLALLALSIFFWIGLFEGIGLAGLEFFGLSGESISRAASPIRAIIATCSPTIDQNWTSEILPYLSVFGGLALLLNGVAVWKVRKWNPSRDVRVGHQVGEEEETQGIFSTDLEKRAIEAEKLRSQHVDARETKNASKSRRVWDNPILWREACTWAYGRKIVLIRVAYWVLAGLIAFSLFSLVNSEQLMAAGGSNISVPPAAKILGPFMLVSIVMINALSVTSITNERDGRSLDLLLVTDLSPREFLFGKLGGIMIITADLILLPIAMSAWLWWANIVSLENLVYIIGGLIVMNIFVAVLGLHCGINYSNSRQAIGVSLGTVFFLFLGVVTCMVMLVSFTGNVEAQFTPFLAFIVGGAVGLYVVLGSRNRSAALALATAILPLAMFFSITSLLLGRYLSVFLVMAFTYGFTTTAMIMPALGEFNIAMGRSKAAGDE